MNPSDYFTEEYIAGRRGTPDVLFHFTHPENAFEILGSGVFRGRPTISLTENPALIAPGSAVFAIDPGCARQGHSLFPYLYNQGYEREAEWVVASKNALFESEGGYTLSERVDLSVMCAIFVGLLPGSMAKKTLVKEFEAVARAARVPFGAFYWEEWWDDGPRPRRRA